jgi:predicted ester cyclase
MATGDVAMSYAPGGVERAMKVQEVIVRALAGRLTWIQAADILQLSPRSVRRWRWRLERDGYDGLFDRRGRVPSPKWAPVAEVQRVLALYRDRYHGFNVRHRPPPRSSHSRGRALDVTGQYIVTLGMIPSDAMYNPSGSARPIASANRRTMLWALGMFGGLASLARSGAALGAEDCQQAARSVAIASALLDKYVAAVNAHDTSAFPEIHTESYIQHSGRSPSGLPAQIETFRGIFARMPDVQARVEDRIIAGDKVVARMAFSATHTQPLQGIAPTGRRFTLRTIDIWRVENGKLAEHWDIVDYAGLQKQLRGE